MHAVGDSPTGPWHHHDVSIPVWAHGSQAVQEPRTGEWLLFFVGGWHYPPTEWASCEPGRANVSWPVEPAGPGLGPVGDCGPKVGLYPIVTLQYSSITSYQVSYHHIQLLFF